ncbi:MAG: hypothetical protein K6C99_08965 [Lachnospiraceae bacterium]|nr:hypothetical protein [Lachnospiraceae bacterium]
MKVLIACIIWMVLVVIMSSHDGLFDGEEYDTKGDRAGNDNNIIPFTLLGQDLNVSDSEELRKHG